MIFENKIVSMYKGMMHTRYDDEETVFYFRPENFPGLKVEPYSFKSVLGHKLYGWFYEYDNARRDRLVVFEHGLGGGHLAYMKEIEKLCSHGFRVFSYDHTGCMRSEGKSTNGLSQSLSDLNDCIASLKADGYFEGCEVSVMGHSWGAFATMNISAIYPEIKRVVAMSGFVSVKDMIDSFFPGIMKPYRKPIYELEKSANPYFVKFNSAESLKKSNAKALLIYSENDNICKRAHYDILNEALRESENVKLLLVKNKGHNPNYTEEAVNCLGEFFEAKTKLAKQKSLTEEEKKKFVSSFDWEKMTEQDESVWQVIFEHLDN